MIELNQANRGDLVRSPTREKLAKFIEDLHADPTALWYFFTIHDTILFPFVEFVKWKTNRERKLAGMEVQRKRSTETIDQNDVLSTNNMENEPNVVEAKKPKVS